MDRRANEWSELKRVIDPVTNLKSIRAFSHEQPIFGMLNIGDAA